MKKVVITVVGKDTVGIIARVCTYLADAGVNILDMSASKRSFDEMQAELDKAGEDIGVSIKCQREEIFDMMHRI